MSTLARRVAAPSARAVATLRTVRAALRRFARARTTKVRLVPFLGLPIVKHARLPRITARFTDDHASWLGSVSQTRTSRAATGPVPVTRMRNVAAWPAAPVRGLAVLVRRRPVFAARTATLARA